MINILFLSWIILSIYAEEINERLNLYEDEVGILLFKTGKIGNQTDGEYECYFKSFESGTDQLLPQLVLNINKSKTEYLFHLSNRSIGTFVANNDFQLIIYKVKISDSGSYKCGNSKYGFVIKLLVEKINSEILYLNEDEDGILLFKTGKYSNKPDVEYECYFKTFQYESEQLILNINESKIQYLMHLSNRTNGTFLPNNSFQLNIHKVTINDNGCYRCGDSQYSFTVKMVVESRPVLMWNGNIIKNNTAFKEDTNVTITCEMYGDNTSILYMTKNGRELTGNSSFILDHKGGKITKIVTTLFNMDDLGKILECRNKRNQTTTRILIDLTVRPELNITNKESIVAGKEVNLTCVSSLRPVNMYWTKNGQLISNGIIESYKDGKLLILKHTLKFTPIKEDNNKTLTCIAEGYNDTSVELQLKVMYGPENVIVNPSEMVVQNGSLLNESFVCKGDGNPHLEFKWYFNTSIVANGSIFSFTRPVTTKDHGEYQCMAFNKINSIIKSVFLDVSSLPTGNNVAVMLALPIVGSILLVVSIILVLIHKSRGPSIQGKYGVKNAMGQNLSISLGMLVSHNNRRNSTEPDIIPSNYDLLRQGKKRPHIRNDNRPNDNNHIAEQSASTSQHNSDGLIYADLNLEHPQSRCVQFKPTVEEKFTEYAYIDFSKKVPPHKAILITNRLYSAMDQLDRESQEPPLIPLRNFN